MENLRMGFFYCGRILPEIFFALIKFSGDMIFGEKRNINGSFFLK